MKNVLLFCLLSVGSLFSQVILTREEMVGSKYRLTFGVVDKSYSIRNENNQRTIVFNTIIDESRESSFILPRSELFIAIPPKTKFDCSLIPVKQNNIDNVTPRRNPRVQILKVSALQYLPAEQREDISLKHQVNVKLRGYLWIGNSYCAHITISPYLYDQQKNQVIELKQFVLEAKLSGSVNVLTGSSKVKINRLIVNTKFASGWQSFRAQYSIPPTDSWIDYTQEYLKIGVAKDGIYRLTYSDLLAEGVPVSTLNPKNFRLYLAGKEVPIYVFGEANNSFNPTDYVEFLGRRNYGDVRYRQPAPTGTPYYEYLNFYSDTTIYWLSWNGGFGKRIDTVLTTAGSPIDTITYYDELVHIENNYYWDFSFNGSQVQSQYPYITENKTWNEGNIGVGQRSISFSVSNLYPNKTARAFVKLQDYSSNIVVGAHDLSLTINAYPTAYDSGSVDKYQVKVLGASFLSTQLSNGVNNVNINSYPTLNSINKVISDWYELEYPRYLNITTDSLTFAYRSLPSPELGVVAISGVTASDMVLYKFSLADSSVAKITNYTLSNDTLRFADSVAAGRYYFLVSEDKISKPTIFYKKKFVNLRSTSNAADYIAITHPYFQSLAINYLSFVSSTYNVRTKLVNVYDIYDEFNYGFFAAEPIREFLETTNTFWQLLQPKYVFLIGGADYDFYGNKAKYFGDPIKPCFVPSYGNPVSDNWFVIWDTTGAMIPQIDIGRLPARTVDEFQHYFNKHQEYASAPYNDWNKKYLFFSGGDITDTSQIATLRSVNDGVINSFVSPPPIGGIVHHFYKTVNPVTNFGPYSLSEITSAIDEGGLFISYLGHSGTETWDNSISDPSQLNNTQNRSPLITDFGCSTAKCAEPDVTSFSELFVNGLKGQAIAYIGNSSLGFTSTAYAFPALFYGTMIEDSVFNLGDAHRIAIGELLSQHGASDVYGLFSLTNTLIGDPIVNLPIPKKPNLVLTSNSVEPLPANVNDMLDSVKISFVYYNWGKVVNDSFGVRLTDHYNGADVFVKIVVRKTPNYADTVSIMVPIKNKTGEHALRIDLDYLQQIDEITKADNSLVFNVNVSSSSVRTMNYYGTENQTDRNITYLNPSLNSGSQSIIVDLSKTPSFLSISTFKFPLDTFYTKFQIDSSYLGSRIWLRSTMEGNNFFGATQSFFVGIKSNYFLGDSVSFASSAMSQLKFRGENIVLDTSLISFGAISAGQNDGSTGVITENSVNYVAGSQARGHDVCVFDAVSYVFKTYRHFDVYGGGTQTVSNYVNFLDSLDNSVLVLIAICDDGSTNVTSDLKNRIKSLGSVYIDSVGFRYSWAIIGRKGSAPGSVPEKYSPPFAGRVEVDTTIVVLNKNGTFLTSQIGPVAQWKSVDISQTTPSGSQIKFRPLGIRTSGVMDTLNYLSVVKNSADISSINASLYPKIQLLGEFSAGFGGSSPSLSQLGVNYVGVPELGTNYQVVQTYKIGSQSNTLSKKSSTKQDDSLLQGEVLGVNCRVYNVGESTADSVKVRTNVVWQNNTVEELGTTTIDSIPSFGYKQLSFAYNSSAGYGNRTFQIFIDPNSTIPELYKDNNYFAIPFVVLRDSIAPQLLDVLFDGTTIQNGDYVSAAPTIDIVVHDQGALSIFDTSTVSLTLDATPVFYNMNQSLSILQGNTPEDLTVRFKPLLAGGSHQLGLRIQNRSGNTSDSTEHLTTFAVDPQLKVEELYNIPNPFSRQTCFTFILTQVPEQLQIKIYTVAGRLIKTITLNGAELEYGFNKVNWDGRDEDGDEIANGVYLYRLVAKGKGQQAAVTQKLVKMR